MKDFLAKIQKSEERVKKRYLFIFSAIAMLVIIGLWIFYLKTIVNAGPRDQAFLKNFFTCLSGRQAALGYWLKFIFLKIKEGQVIIIER